MEDEADRIKDEAKTGHEQGGVQAIRGEHRARVKYTDSNGAQSEIYGPCRNDQRRAQADLEAIRAAAASKPTQTEHFETMANEAHRLQKHAAFEVEVAIAVGKEQFDRKHMQTDSESGPDDEPFPDYDVSTRAAVKRLMTSPQPRKISRKEAPPASMFEATAQLSRFRPVYGDVASLRALLEARADPNINLGQSIASSPLGRVTTFAPDWNVCEMRQLLIDYGAVEGQADKKRWGTREESIIGEPIWLANFHRDDRMG
jgi:hypothetical protein